MRQDFWSLSRKLNTGPPSYKPAAYYEPPSVRWAKRTETACLQTRTVRRSLNRGVSLCVCLSVSVAWLIKHCTDLCYSNGYDPSYEGCLVMNYNSSLYVSNSKLWQMKWAFCDQCPPFTSGHSDKWWRNLERRACCRSSSTFCTETWLILAVASVFLAEC
jgi:hypothetical protein